MSLLQGFGKFSQNLLKPVSFIFRCIRYSDFDVAEYYRKQGADIGANCCIQDRSPWSEPFLVSIGNHVLISRNVVFHTDDGGTWILEREIPGINVFGTIVVEDNCLIGCNSQLFLNTRIGKNSIVEPGSVVISNVPPNSIVMGVPARVIGTTLKYRERCLALWKEQKPHAWPMKDKKKAELELRKHLATYFDGRNQNKSQLY
jgi:acetyltransferase-like isoleucine patch superfamily enzyme